VEHCRPFSLRIIPFSPPFFSSRSFVSFSRRTAANPHPPDLGGLDDNLTLPIISGGALMLFFRVWGWAVGAA
jgi:hypothetical protein